MKARFDIEQQSVHHTLFGGKVHIFICLNGEWACDMTDTGDTYWECDYNEIVCDPSAIDIGDVYSHPEKYIDYKNVSENKTDKERIAQLEAENKLLTECVLELSSIVYA